MEASFAILRGVGAGAGDDAIVLIQDGDETTFLPHAVVIGFGSKTDAGVEVFSVEHRATDVGSGEIHAAHRLSLESKPIELVSDSLRAKQQRGSAALINGDAVSLHESARVQGLGAFSPEFRNEPSRLIEAEDELGAIAVGHVDVAIRCHGGFGGAVGIVFLVRSDVFGFWEFEEYASFQVRFENPAAGVCDVERFGAVRFCMESEAVSAGETEGP